MKPRIIPQETQARRPFFVSLAGLIIGLAAIIVFWQKLPPQVPIFYNKPWGEEQLASPIFLFLPLGISGIFLAVNTLFVSVLPESVFLKRALILAAAVSSVLASIAVVRVLFLIS